MNSGIISNTSIENIYKDIKPINRIDITIRSSHATGKSVTIDIFNKKNECMNDLEITRHYYKNVKLIGKEGKGKVAEHSFFVLYEEYKDNQIAKKLYVKEGIIYHKNEFKQVQLEAAWDGIVVWRKLGYSYENEKKDSYIVSLWRDYVDEIFDDIDAEEYERVIKTYKTVEKLPRTYLTPSNKLSFSDWIEQSDIALSATMYRNIS